MCSLTQKQPKNPNGHENIGYLNSTVKHEQIDATYFPPPNKYKLRAALIKQYLKPKTMGTRIPGKQRCIVHENMPSLKTPIKEFILISENWNLTCKF